MSADEFFPAMSKDGYSERMPEMYGDHVGRNVLSRMFGVWGDFASLSCNVFDRLYAKSASA
jgi:hypothetical protein